MPADAVERKLVAILAADIVGYSRLVGLDEGGTLARLKALRHELIDPTISEHKGRIVKTTGHRDRIVSGCGPTRREDRAP
jgi:adenylate cyclase